ncbi:hypothetical protein HYDPIDRAFT_114796 [Hydnomerulius pinastri MD-312]|uniref:Hemerythrin-like domain-containing protein n=1 Tax=Hydnomerulius pinastri MD-312 TaxID=994086 RepID=A0A0C9WCN3_9AGAM|nr:hypothetical protein HYDPIDRAFT_114796 [Hydnomerulius pinastri MD-312]
MLCRNALKTVPALSRSTIYSSIAIPRTTILRATMVTTTQTPLKDAVAHDHQEMYDYYDQYRKSAGDTDAQSRWANQLTWEVARHAVGEEIIIYPLMEKHLGQNGKDLADQDRADHQTVKECLSQLGTMKVGTDEYDHTISRMMSQLHEHNDSEENKDLPQLEEKLHLDHSREAAQQFKTTKRFVPTRPHPSAPDQPPFETLVAFMTAPIDKLKDVFASFPTEEMKQEMKESSR